LIRASRQAGRSRPAGSDPPAWRIRWFRSRSPGWRPGEEAYVSVSAVDVGILNLTRHEGADPESWYFGQRALGLEIRDLYGRLIDGSAGVTGRIRTGGDGR
jgi:uncharacterized protein YfaS (alpha-2-macroglobulin family)